MSDNEKATQMSTAERVGWALFAIGGLVVVPMLAWLVFQDPSVQGALRLAGATLGFVLFAYMAIRGRHPRFFRGRNHPS